MIPRAAFLACSWTWCIGMFLPVILVRDFGLAGWVVFAIPNVIGAAALPFVLRTPEASERYVARHATAMKWFSAVTIAFHVFFLASIGFVGLMFFVPREPRVNVADAVTVALLIGPAMAVGAMILGWGAARGSARFWRIASPLVWVFSCALFGLADRAAGFDLRLPDASTRQLAGLAALAPIVVFGFALCPYLDLTFHRVRREAPGRTASAAFVLGFGGFFLLMIAGTLLYATHLVERGVVAPLVAHFFTQSAFTVGAHARELRERWGAESSRWIVAPAFVGALAAVLPLAGRWWLTGVTPDRVYLCFMAFYAVAFPAYVWITARPREALSASDSPAPARTVWAATTLLTAPMLWLGFIEKQWFWLAPAAVLALISRPISLALSRAKHAR